MFKLLIFDLGKVVVDYDWDSFCRSFAQKSGADLITVKDFFAHDYFHKGRYERGAITTAQLVEEINQKIGTRISLTEFEIIWTEGLCFTENKDTTKLLEQLDGQCRKWMLSNTSKIHYDYLHSKFDVGKHFEDRVLSYEVGKVKPEPEIYKEVLKRSGVLAEECLFIDDLLYNVEGAQALGIQGHHFTGVELLRLELRKSGLSV